MVEATDKLLINTFDGGRLGVVDSFDDDLGILDQLILGEGTLADA